MGSSSWWGLSGTVRALAALAIASGAVVGVATTAEAEAITDVDGLKESCAKGNGTYTELTLTNGKAGVCDVQGGYVYCKTTETESECHGVRTRKRTLIPTEAVRAGDGVKMTTQDVPDAHVWKQKLNVPTLADVCTNLGGDLVASANSTFATCVAQTATIVCRDTSSGTNCVGFADTKKQAASIPKQIKIYVSENAGGTPSPSTSETTTTTSATDTTVTTGPLEETP